MTHTVIRSALRAKKTLGAAVAALLVSVLLLGSAAPAAADVSALTARSVLDDSAPESGDEQQPVESPAPAVPEEDDSDGEQPAEPAEPLKETEQPSPPAIAPDTVTPSISPLAIEFGFGKGNNFNTTDQPTGTVLGYNGVPTDLGTRNRHFVYFPIPNKTVTTTHNPGVIETLSMSKYVDGTTGLFTLAINSAGKVYAWGGNRNGQLGLGADTAGYQKPTDQSLQSRISPGAVTSLPSDRTFVQVSAGGNHALALTSTGEIFSWGGNNRRQLGHTFENTVGTGAAQKIVAMDGDTEVRFTQVSAGADYSLAVSTTGDVWSWGNSSNGNVGGGGKKAGLSNIKMVSAGRDHAGAVSNNGELFMWGYQFNGRVGNGVTTGTAGVTRINATFSGSQVSWKMVSAGNASTWAVTTTGELFAWGDNSNYQLGNGSGGAGNQVTRPGWVASGVSQVSGNSYAAVAVRTDGRIMTTGSNQNAQLGVGGTANDSTIRASWSILTTVTGAREATMGFSGVAARGTNGIQSWGKNMQTGRTGTQVFQTPGTVNGVGAGLPETTGVTTTVTTTLTDDEARGSGISFGSPASPQSITGWQMAHNITVVTNNGIRYLRGDVPPHAAGGVSIYLKWNDGVSDWEDTGGRYVYTIALRVDSNPRPAPTTDPVDVTASFYDPAEAHYVGSTVVSFTIPALNGASAALTRAKGSPVNNVSFASGSAKATVLLAVPNPPANNGPGQWTYPASVNARDPQLNIAVNRNVPTTPIEFVTANQTVYLWKTGESVNSQVVGMSGSTWKLHPESAATPGRPDINVTVPGFGSEIRNPNSGTGNRANGWFSAELAPGTYWLFETKAPDGFGLLAQPVQFTVAANGSVTLGSGKSAYTTVSGAWNQSSSSNTIVVQDAGRIPLPEAGSNPVWWFTALGILLLIAGAAVATRYVARRRRSDESEPLAPEPLVPAAVLPDTRRSRRPRA